MELDRSTGDRRSEGSDLVTVDISVIIPCHNEERFLAQQLESLAQQDFDGQWEVIVVDNRSTDATVQVARGFSPLADRLRVVRADDRASAAYARAEGVAAALADRLAFCDADDRVGTGWLRALAGALVHHGLVTGRVEVDTLNDEHLAASRGRRNEESQLRFGDVPVFRSNTGGMSRQCWDLLGGFRDHALEDIELSIRAASSGLTVFFVPEAIVSYRYRDSGRALWAQGVTYGEGFSQLGIQARSAGLRPPSRMSAAKSWMWLLARAPFLWRSDLRSRWCWTCAVRWGTVRSRARHLARALLRRVGRS